jgi:hypothetical protein
MMRRTTETLSRLRMDLAPHEKDHLELSWHPPLLVGELSLLSLQAHQSKMHKIGIAARRKELMMRKTRLPDQHPELRLAYETHRSVV